MTKINLNNQIGSRSTHKMNLVVAQVGDDQLLFEFTGVGIPGAVTVVQEDYEKNGKWSFSTWAVELSDGLHCFLWYQDWEQGNYLTAKTWESAREHVRKTAKKHTLTGSFDLKDEAIDRFVRARLPNTAARLDAAEAERTRDPTPILEDLLAAQAELAEAQKDLSAAQAERGQLAAEVKQALEARAAAEKSRQEAAATADRVTKAKAAMARGASLADLKEMLG